MEILNDSQWRLKSINITFQEWGEYKGKYLGKIQFGNGQQEAFSFNIHEDKAMQFLALIKDSVVDSAAQLGNRVLQSLPSELMAPAPQNAIEDTNIIPVDPK